MPCKVAIDQAIQSDILDCAPADRIQIGRFLLALQEDPLPSIRKDLAIKAFYAVLPCGYTVAWEVSGDHLKFAATRGTEGILVRILGISRKAPG